MASDRDETGLRLNRDAGSVDEFRDVEEPAGRARHDRVPEASLSTTARGRPRERANVDGKSRLRYVACPPGYHRLRPFQGESRP